MTFFQRFVIGLRAFRKLVRNPACPVSGPLFQQCVEYRLHQRFARLFQKTTDGARLLSGRPHLNASACPIATMSDLPRGTFGHAFANYFTEHGISQLEASQIDLSTSDAEYVCARLRESHDVLHVVTGYGTDPVGEIELQAFNLGNMGFGPIPIIAIVGAVLMGVSSHCGFGTLVRRLREAYRHGKRTRFLADVMWEDHWTKPLTDVRAGLVSSLNEAG